MIQDASFRDDKSNCAGPLRIARNCRSRNAEGNAMLQKPKCPVIAIEEHYWDHELAQYYQNVERQPEVVKRMTDFGELRIKEMDEAGIDIQVISHGAASMQNVKADVAVEMGRRVNDRLAEICAQKPDRFAAFGALPTADPVAASDELARCVERLGF